MRERVPARSCRLGSTLGRTPTHVIFEPLDFIARLVVLVAQATGQPDPFPWGLRAQQPVPGARDLAKEMEVKGEGRVLDQFSNPDNPRAHYEGTGPELWRDTEGRITHFVSSMGTTGTIVGTARFFREQDKKVEIVGVQPSEGASIPGIRRWPAAYLPTIFDASLVDRTIDVSQQEAEDTTRRLAREEGIFCGISSGGATAAALRLSREVENAVIAVIICDRGDRYLSTGVFPD